MASGEISRRTTLGVLGASSASFCATLANAGEPIRSRPKAKSVILIFNSGAPSHLDLWDPKPDANESTRGPFEAITTNVSGIQLTELLPRMATRMDKLSIVRTVQHKHTSHNSGMYWSIVGRPYHKDSTHINPSGTDHPSFGTMVSWLAQRDGYTGGGVPPYVLAPFPQCDSGNWITPGQFGGCLGRHYDPFVFDSDKRSDAKVQSLRLSGGMTPRRFADRLSLLGKIGSRSAAELGPQAGGEIDILNERAASIVLSGKAAEVFDLSREPDAVRQRYGRHSWGQAHLLARRLVESGSRFVTAVNGRSIIWDTHTDNFNRMKNTLVPPMEQAFAALVDDLDERGLLDTTLVVWMGDFGRTPKINKNAGRDHWPGCYSVVLAGGGIRGGQVVGRSDSVGGHPEERPVSPADIHATVYKALGYDHRRLQYHMVDGRPMPITTGTPIAELL